MAESPGTHSDDLLHGPLLRPLSQPDRDLATALVLGVLRWQIALDARVRPFLSRPDLALAEAVAVCLRMGAFQLLHMERIPAHAALNESVELVRSAGQPHAAGMVNAILRRLVDAPAARKPLVEALPAMAERLGHPAWLPVRWAGTYGRAAAEAICGFNQQEPARSAIFTPDPEPFPAMDAGSRLVAEIAAVAGDGAKRVWDCCAAPGGKTVVLGKRMSGAELVATDVSESRLRRLRQRLERDLPGGQARVVHADAADLPPALGSFDLILCDVPCSGTGTLARNPEIRHRLRPEEFSRQAERQRRILRGGLQRLAPGGTLVYSTCSLEPEECEAVVNAVLAEIGVGMERLALDPVLDTLRERGILAAETSDRERWTREGCLRTLPGHSFVGDGFFAAAIRRVR